MDEDFMWTLRECSKVYDVVYETLNRRCNDKKRKFKTQKNLSPKGKRAQWVVDHREIGEEYPKREVVDLEAAEKSVEEQASEIEKLKQRIADLGEELQAQKTKVVAAESRAKDFEERSNKAWGRVDSVNEQAEKKITAANGERDEYKGAAVDIAATLDEVLKSLPEKAQLKRRERKNWDTEKNRLWALNATAKKQLKAGGVPSEQAPVMDA